MVELKLGYGEQDREAQKMLAIHQLFSQDPALRRCTGCHATLCEEILGSRAYLMLMNT